MADDETEETFLTVAEVAAMLKLNQQTVRNWIDADKLPHVRVGRRVRIKRSDFERVVEQGYSGRMRADPERHDPTGEDFWGGASVGVAEPGPAGSTATSPPAR